MIKIDSASWRKAGSVVEQTGRDLRCELESQLANLQHSETKGGIRELDDLIDQMLPAVLEAVNPTIDGICQGLADEGAELIRTGDSYAEVEVEANELNESWEDED